jgi:hypothetical protein
MALIVSHALPKGLRTFDRIDGVWVTEPRCAVAVAIALREYVSECCFDAATFRRMRQSGIALVF